MLRDAGQVRRLTSVRTEMEAGLLVAELEEHGIRSAMAGVHTANFRAEAPGWIDVLVADQDHHQALSVINDLQPEKCNIDWEALDVGTPAEEVESAASEGPSGWAAWRKACLLLVAAYLVWVAVGLVIDLIRLAWQR